MKTAERGMYISRIELSHVGCLDNALLDLSPGVNVIVGPNGSGKSTILAAAYLIQHNEALSPYGHRRGEAQGHVLLTFEDPNGRFLEIPGMLRPAAQLKVNL